jgi:type III pantothenate kinase
VLLAIDVGNTHTVLGLLDGEKVVDNWRVATEARRTADETVVLVRGLLAQRSSVDPIDGIAVCSTVPSVLHEMREMVARYFSTIPVVVVEPGIRTGVPVLVDNPREVGSDRVVNALAAFHLYKKPAIVVDFGTATTFDVVSSRGEYLGGAIAPGIGISVDALAGRAAQLLKVELLPPRSVIGKGTVEALQSGILYGFAGQVDGIVERMAVELDVPLQELAVIATGGLASVVVDESRTITHHEPWLTLIGLRVIYDRNTASKPPTGHDRERGEGRAAL